MQAVIGTDVKADTIIDGAALQPDAISVSLQPDEIIDGDDLQADATIDGATLHPDATSDGAAIHTTTYGIALYIRPLIHTSGCNH